MRLNTLCLQKQLCVCVSITIQFKPMTGGCRVRRLSGFSQLQHTKGDRLESDWKHSVWFRRRWHLKRAGGRTWRKCTLRKSWMIEMSPTCARSLWILRKFTCSRHTWTQSDITQTDRPLWLQMTSPVRDGSTWIRSTDRRKTNMEIFMTPLQPCECCICLLISLTSKLICHHHHHRRKGRKFHTFLFIFELLINSVAVLSLSVWVWSDFG